MWRSGMTTKIFFGHELSLPNVIVLYDLILSATVQIIFEINLHMGITKKQTLNVRLNHFFQIQLKAIVNTKFILSVTAPTLNYK